MNNISAGYFNSCLGVGEALGPISASLLSHSVGFRSAEDIFASCILIYCFAFFMMNGKLKIFKLNNLQVKVDHSKDDEFIPADIGGLGAGSTGDSN